MRWAAESYGPRRLLAGSAVLVSFAAWQPLCAKRAGLAQGAIKPKQTLHGY